ncbi:MAG: helix-turn-helix domain-containing protein [Actinomycetota bacterium]|nr:helix-turn-helix domain-containing protein [Actinomycetota bacterium]
MASAGCVTLWPNGSFVTDKAWPNDFDACWDPDGVDLEAIDPALLDLDHPRTSQKDRYGGELSGLNLGKLPAARCSSTSSRPIATPVSPRHHRPRPQELRLMIKDKRQYQLTRAQADRFEAVLVDLAQRPGESGEHPRLRQAKIDAVISQRDDLLAQLAEYDALVSGQRPLVEVPFAEFPQGLIAARIASGMTQGELGARVRTKEQQIQRYEATDYASASLTRINKIIGVLGVRVRSELRFGGHQSSA